MIDSQSCMFEPISPSSNTNEGTDPPPSRTTTPFDLALKSCDKLLRLRIRHEATTKTGKRDGVGVMLYGTRPQNEEEGYHIINTFELVPMKPPGIDAVLDLRDCLPVDDDGERRRCLQTEFGNHDDDDDDSGNVSSSSLRRGLHEAIKIFERATCVKKRTTSSSSKRYSPNDAKTIWIFTNNDNPCSSLDERRRIKTTARDATDNDIKIQVWSLPHSQKKDFDLKVFFDDIVTTKLNATPFRGDGGVEDDDDDWDDFFLRQVGQRWKTPRRVFCLPLLLPGWEKEEERVTNEVDYDSSSEEEEEVVETTMMLDLFRLVSVKRKPQPVKVHQRSNRPVTKETRYFNSRTGRLLSSTKPSHNHHIRTYIPFASTQHEIPLSYHELNQLKKQCNANPQRASLLLLGFKPKSRVVLDFMNDGAYFAYPTSGGGGKKHGGKVALGTLHASMVKKDVVGIGEMLTRVTGTSRLVAIVPQRDERKNTEQTFPAGFLIIPLPFEDDMRAIPSDDDEHDDDATTVDNNDAIVDAAVELIKKQTMENLEWGYSFENPSLKRFWNYMESVALGVRIPATQQECDDDDNTLMKDMSVLNKAATYIQEFNSLLPIVDDDDDGATGTKKQKHDIPVDDNGDIDWIAIYKSNGLTLCTNDVLKSYLRDWDLRVTGRKEVLVDRIMGHIKDRLDDDGDYEDVKTCDDRGGTDIVTNVEDDDNKRGIKLECCDV